MEFRPLHRDLGAEVIGFDVQSGGSDREIAQLRGAYDRYQMLLFRGGGRVSPERQVEITGWFGPPAPVANDGQGNLVTVLDNDDPAGSFRLPFHSDLTWAEVPIKAICLHAVALPENPTSTTFVSGIAAWNRLSEDRRRELEGLSSRHFYQSDMPGLDWPTFTNEHPIRFAHPRTGKPILFVTENHADRVVGMDEAAGGALLVGLFDVLYAPDAHYEHVWQIDDLLLWDNLALQHARTRYSDPGAGKRALQRVALAEMSFHELLERQRARQVV